MTLNYMVFNYIFLLSLLNVAMVLYTIGTKGEKQVGQISYAILLMLLAVSDFAGKLSEDPVIRIIFYIFSYFGRSLLVWLIAENVTKEFPRVVRHLVATLVFLNLVLCVLSLETGWIYEATISPDGTVAFQFRPGGVWNLLIYGICIAVIIRDAVSEKKTGWRRRLILLVIFTLQVAAANVFDMIVQQRLMFLPVICISVLAYTLFVDVQTSRRNETEQSYLLKLRQQEVMLNQVQPHFLYNTLGTIRYLIGTDPELAVESVNDLARYLRANVHTTNMAEWTSIEKEIENIRLYVKIEKLRFPEYEVRYELQDMDCMVPVLSVQPLVENALKHGIRGVKGGYVRIRSWFENEKHYIEVSDNGKGFDPAAVDYHVGIQNVRERLKLLAGGELTVRSRPGEGTTVLLCIPETDG